jgi:hypothetical protein
VIKTTYVVEGSSELVVVAVMELPSSTDNVFCPGKLKLLHERD